jgi:DNA polymerase-3 subunit epsilon
MGKVSTDTFVCLDCESTGLNVESDRIVEIALVQFTFDNHLNNFESLINPECIIPKEAIDIHNISQAMVQDKPLIKDVLPTILEMLGNYPIVGHGISFDINLIKAEARRANINCSLKNPLIDTLRLARLYAAAPINSLEKLCDHFHIEVKKAHRAMNDVIVNIEVFKKLANYFSTTEAILKRLKSPILLNLMPLGKYKGEKFSQIPLEYLLWASHMDFDDDLLFSINSEINNRQRKNHFEQSSNPFSSLN